MEGCKRRRREVKDGEGKREGRKGGKERGVAIQLHLLDLPVIVCLFVLYFCSFSGLVLLVGHQERCQTCNSS